MRSGTHTKNKASKEHTLHHITVYSLYHEDVSWFAYLVDAPVFTTYSCIVRIVVSSLSAMSLISHSYYNTLQFEVRTCR